MAQYNNMAVPPPPGALQHYHGHTFGKKTFHKPTYCHHCSDMLWGLIQQGFICEGMFSYFYLYFK